MCGIFAASGPTDPEGLEAVLRAIAHRGPDDQGAYRSPEGDCLLGHVRLSILDLSPAGHQPMADATGRYHLTFNGEIYNYQELKTELLHRHGPIRWRGGSDTEVIVEGFAREGIPFLDRLNGIFALALYDARDRRLHVLRDPLGIKPLFITEQQGSVRFCSELKGLLAIPGLSRTLRPGAFADQLAFMYLPEPFTFFREFEKVSPGVCFTYGDGRLLAAVPLFRHLEDPLDFASEEEAVGLLRSALDRAVHRQLMADVPVSLYLSGGLDSSAVAHFAVGGGAKVRNAFTIAFAPEDRRQDLQGDDLHFAKLVSGRLGLDLNVIPAERDFLNLLPDLSAFMEDGFSDPAAINTYLISAGARRSGVKVMLSGQGADEFLGGYRRYRAERMLQDLPTPLRAAVAGVGQLIASSLGRFGTSGGRRLARFARLARHHQADRLLDLYTWTTPEHVAGLLQKAPDKGSAGAFLALFDAHREKEITEAMMRVDQHYDLMSLNLCYTDRMSMAAGVEARVPFLDFDLVRIMNSLPPRLKVRGREGKYALKKAMEPCLPREVIYRSKTGFGLPVRAWMRRSGAMLDHYLEPQRLQRQGIFRAEAVGHMKEAQLNGDADHAYTLFTLLCQQLWIDRHGGLQA